VPTLPGSDPDKAHGAPKKEEIAKSSADAIVLGGSYFSAYGALPTTALLQHHRFPTLIPPKRLNKHRSEHSDETLNTANHRSDRHKLMVGGAHPDMVDSCQEKNRPPAQRLLTPDSLLWMYSKAPEGAEPF